MRKGVCEDNKLIWAENVVACRLALTGFVMAVTGCATPAPADPQPIDKYLCLCSACVAIKLMSFMCLTCLLCVDSQTWRQPSWQYGAHDGVFVQLQALIPRPSQDDTSDKGARDSSDGSGSKAADGSCKSSVVLNKVWFVRLRPDKPPS